MAEEWGWKQNRPKWKQLYDALREGVSELKLAGDGYEEEGRLPEQERVDRSLLALEDVLKSLRGGTEPSRV